MQWATPEERRNLGQARRKQVGRQEHNELKPKARQTPAAELLARSMSGRVPALIKLKYALMAASPFGYFRGAVPVMAADLALLPSTGLTAQLCGDAHVRNLGAFAAPDGRLTFDINDFDETIRGPFEWDLKRMAASLVLAGRESGHKDASARAAVEKMVARYSAQMSAFSKMTFLDVAHYQVHRLNLIAPVQKALLKAEHATPQHTLDQLTEPIASHPFPKERGKDGARAKANAGPSTTLRSAQDDKVKDGKERRFKEIKPNLTHVTSTQAAAVLAALGPYRLMLEPQRRHLLSLYRPVDVAFKVVGTGSVGLRDYCIYFEGNGPADPLFLQIKEEPASGYAPYLPDAQSPPTTASASPRARRRCRSNPTPSSAGRTSAGATTSSASSTTTKAPSSWKTWPAAAWKAMPKSAASCSPAVTPAPATRSSSMATSAPATASPKH